MASTPNFPVVSFAPFLTGTETEQRVVAQELYDAFSVYGWIYLKDFGINQQEIDALFATSKKYFDRPLESKMKERLDDPAVNQGYTPLGGEDGGAEVVSHKECYEHRRFNNAKCPSNEELQGFKAFMDNFYQRIHKLSLEVLRALALILNLESTFFDNYMAKSDAQFRLLHYMPVPKSLLENPINTRINPHTDFGFCTILFQDSVGGLEIDPFHTKKFLPATPIPGTCVINIADLLQRLSNDRLRSTMHRVTAPQLTEEQLRELGEDGMLPARYSAAFFVHPSPDTTVKPLVQKDEVPKYEPVNAGLWRTQITARNYSLPIAT